MNAHNMMNPGAFGLSGLLLRQNYRTDDFYTSYDVWTDMWNDRNGMTGFSEKNALGTVIASGTHTYDSLDRRIGVDETSGGTTTQTSIVYNGNSNTPYAEFNGSGTLLERYLAGPSYVPGVTGMIARTNASGVTDWYLTGKLGSAPDIVDTSGTVIDDISYGAFGSIRAETNPSSGSQFKFEGMAYDQFLNIYYDNARLHSSLDGRFLSQDTLSFTAEDSNLFRYVNNSSLNMIDISGLSYSGGSNSLNAASDQLQMTQKYKNLISQQKAYKAATEQYIIDLQAYIKRAKLAENTERKEMETAWEHAARLSMIAYAKMQKKDYLDALIRYNQLTLQYNLYIQAYINLIQRNNNQDPGYTTIEAPTSNPLPPAPTAPIKPPGNFRPAANPWEPGSTKYPSYIPYTNPPWAGLPFCPQKQPIQPQSPESPKPPIIYK
jgi:RHS repeat-associated protein